MKSDKTKLAFAALPKKYAELCRIHLPRPIHDEIDFANTMEIIEAMAGHELSKDQDDYLDLLSQLVENYEKEHAPRRMRRATGLQVLKHVLEENKMTATDLARLLGVHRTLGPKLLTGNRQLTAGHIRTLSKRFGLPADVLLRVCER